MGKVVTPSVPPPPYEQFLPLPTPYRPALRILRSFFERLLNDLPTPTASLQASFTVIPTAPTTPALHKIFDRTLVWPHTPPPPAGASCLMIEFHYQISLSFLHPFFDNHTVLQIPSRLFVMSSFSLTKSLRYLNIFHQKKNLTQM